MDADVQALLVSRRRYQRNCPKLDSLLNVRDCFDELYTEQEKAVQKRQLTIEGLNEIAQKLDKRHFDVNISKLVGSSVGIVGGTVAVAGAIAAPFTAGISLILGAVGGGVAALGGFITGGADVTEIVLKWHGLKKAQHALDEDQKQCDKLMKLWEKYKEMSEEAVNEIEAAKDPELLPLKKSWEQWVNEMKADFAEKFPRAWKAACFFWEALSFIKHCTKVGWTVFKQMTSLCDIAVVIVRGMEGAVKSSTKTLAKVVIRIIGTRGWMVLDGLLSVVGVGIDLYVLIRTAIDVHKGSHSDAANKLRKLVKQLQEEESTWKQILPSSTTARA